MEELAIKIREFSVSDDPLSTETAGNFIDAFAPVSLSINSRSSSVKHGRQARSSALVALATRSSSAALQAGQSRKGDEDLSSLLTPLIRSRLADTLPSSLISALRFLSSFFTVSPIDAQGIISADGILDLILEAPDTCNPTSRDMADVERRLVVWSLADMLSSAANSTATRKYLSQQQNVLDWLDIYSSPRTSRNKEEDLPWWNSTEVVAVVAGLCDLKLGQALAVQANEDFTASLTSSSSKPASKEQHLRAVAETKAERQRKDTSLFEATCYELTSGPRIDDTDTETHDLLQQARLSCYEALTWLTIQPAFKAKLTETQNLLRAVCKGLTISSKPNNANPEAPSDPNKGQKESSDGALQLSLATIVVNVTTYKPSLTDEQKQISKLRKFASAQGDGSDNAAAEADDLDTDAQVEQRCAVIIEEQGAAMVCAIATAETRVSGDARSVPLNPSKAVREATSKALLSLLTKQDRMMRGRVVQQGGMRALLALSAPVFNTLTQASVQPSSNVFAAAPVDVTVEDLVPLQGLCKILISLNPAALFPSQESAVAVVPLIASMVLCQASNRLQKFEGLLALTNLASISPNVAGHIAQCNPSKTKKLEKEEDEDDGKFGEGTLLNWLCETLVLEDHPMLRRAIIELLVNLCQVEAVFDHFTTSRTVHQGADVDKGMDRFTLRLKILLSASEANEDDHDESGNEVGSTDVRYVDDSGSESSIATRLASLALLAMTTESPAINNTLLSFRNTVPILLSTLAATSDESVTPTSDKDQMNAINLSLRAGYTLFNLVQHLVSGGEIERKSSPMGGLDRPALETSLQTTVQYHISCLQKQSGSASEKVPALKDARSALLQVLLELVKLVKQLSK